MDAATVRRDHDGDRSRVLPIQLAQAGLQTLPPRGGAVRCGQSSRVGMGVNVHPMVLDTEGRWPTPSASDAVRGHSDRHGPERSCEQVVFAADEGVQVDGLEGRLLRRATEQVALAGADAE